MISLSQTRIKKTMKVQQAMNQVNDLISSVVTMQLNSIERQISTCSKITGQLLQNDLISHMRSIPSLKLLVYELILKLAEQTQLLCQSQRNEKERSRQTGYPLQQNTMNRIIMYDEAVKRALFSTKDMLQELSWTLPQKSKSRSKTQKTIGKGTNEISSGSGKVKYYLKQLENLISQYENHVKQNPFVISRPQIKQQSQYDEQGQNALIQQMQSVITKKEQENRKLVKQLQTALLDLRTMQNLIQQSDIQKEQLEEELSKIRQQYQNMEQQNNRLAEQNKQLAFNQARQNFNSILDPQEPTSPLFHVQDDMSVNQMLKKQILQGQNLQRMLFLQAISVQSLLCLNSPQQEYQS